MALARFYFAWLLKNLIGFLVGSFLGATNYGLFPAIMPGIPGLIVGDLIFGAVIGLAQWQFFRNNPSFGVSAWWIVGSSIGFTLGARSGALLTYRLVNDWLPPSVIFGVFMGGTIGLTTMLSLRKAVGWPQLLRWPVVSILAWIPGEVIAFTTHFSPYTIPFVALVIGGITGLELLRLQTSPTLNPHFQFSKINSLEKE